MGKRKGFTLIELMIVIAIIAIIAAFAIPNLLKARMAANETGAIAGLDAIVKAEETFRKGNYDQDNVPNYWVNDVRGLYALPEVPNSTTPLNAIGQDLAAADFAPDTNPPVPYVVNLTTAAKSGYYYVVMLNDENGTPYTDLKTSRYAFLAFPDSCNRSGSIVAIACEGGTKYKSSCINGANPANNFDSSTFAAQGANWRNWPAAPVIGVNNPNGNPWQQPE